MSRTAGTATRRHAAIAPGLAVVAVAVYARALLNPFVDLDDPDYVAVNAHVTAGPTPENLMWAFTSGHAANWHPLTWISHMADAALFGMRPWGHHLTSVLFHAANAALLFLVLASMTRAVWRSGFAAALFALHPLHVESVAWVAERKDVLSAFFGLLTLAAYAGYVRRPSVGRYIGTAACLALGLMAKPMLVTLPFVLVLLDVWPLGRASPPAPRSAPGVRPLGTLFLEKTPFLLLAAASSAVTYAVQRAGGTVMNLDALPLKVRVMNALVATCIYASKTIWPTSLAIRYPFTPGGEPAWKWMGAAVVLLSLTLIALRQLRRAPYLAVGWCWYLGMLVPVIGLIQVGSQSMADRYTYLPGIGLFVLIAWGVGDLLAPRLRGPGLRSIALPSAAILVLAALATMTYVQIGYWRSSLALFDHAFAVVPNNYLAVNDAGLALANDGRFEEALPRFRKALEIWPGYASARNNLGMALVHLGRTGEAEPYLREALRLKPELPMAHYFLGVILSGRGDLEQAMSHFRESIRLDPSLSLPRNQMGMILIRLGRPDEAIPFLREAVRLAPAEPTAHSNLGTALARRGEIDEAILQFREAIRNRPEFPQAERSLGLALLRAGRIDDAIVHLREAVRLDPGDAGARADLDAALAKRGRGSSPSRS